METNTHFLGPQGSSQVADVSQSTLEWRVWMSQLKALSALGFYVCGSA